MRGTTLAPDERYTLTKRQGKQAIYNLDSAIAKGRIPKNLTLYRGMGDNDIEKYIVGNTLSDDGFLSTSLDETEAVKFAQRSTEDGYKHKVLLEIHIREEHPAAQVFGGLQEYEVLLPRRAQWKIVSRTQAGGLLRVVVELMR